MRRHVDKIRAVRWCASQVERACSRGHEDTTDWLLSPSMVPQGTRSPSRSAFYIDGLFLLLPLYSPDRRSLDVCCCAGFSGGYVPCAGKSGATPDTGSEWTVQTRRKNDPPSAARCTEKGHDGTHTSYGRRTPKTPWPFCCLNGDERKSHPHRPRQVLTKTSNSVPSEVLNGIRVQDGVGLRFPSSPVVVPSVADLPLEFSQEREGEKKPRNPVPRYVVTFDGGCRPTNPGNKYGSWRVCLLVDKSEQEVVKVARCEFGYGTNNEAEFEALIHALEHVRSHVLKHGVKGYEVVMLTDSVIVRNRIANRTRRNIGEAGMRMAALASECHRLLKHRDCIGYRIEWRGRHHNVKEFGH